MLTFLGSIWRAPPSGIEFCEGFSSPKHVEAELLTLLVKGAKLPTLRLRDHTL